MIKAHGNIFEFTKDIAISCFSETYSADSWHSNVEDSSIFAFQIIDVAGLKLNLFYDSGCGDLVVSKEAADMLQEIRRAKQEFTVVNLVIMLLVRVDWNSQKAIRHMFPEEAQSV